MSELDTRVSTIEEIVQKLNRAQVDVRREEHDEVLRTIEQLARHAQGLQTQLARIAQIQAELDALKRTVAKISGSS